MKKLLIVLLLLCCFHTMVKAQNLFDCRHSLSFAAYLKSHGSFNLAGKVLSEAGDSCLNDSIIMEILMINISEKKYELAYANSVKLIQKARSIDSRSNISSVLLKSKIAAGLKPTDREWKSVADLIHLDSFCFIRKCGFLLDFSTRKTRDSDTLAIPTLIYWDLAKKEIKFKSPVKAALLSAVIPGMGKAYAGLKRDAFLSFISVGFSTFQAVRGFNAKGASSIYGWISSAFAVSFYGGCIYGSTTSVKKYNKKKIDEYRNKFIQNVFHY